MAARNTNSDTELHKAARLGDADRAVRALQEGRGRLWLWISMANSAGESPLYLAIVAKSYNVVDVLLKYLLELSRNSSSILTAAYAGPAGKTALHAAVLCSKDITQRLLQSEGRLNRQADDSQDLPLHYAASCGDSAMVKLLLEHDKTIAYERDANGSTIIHIAARNGYLEIIKKVKRICPESTEELDHHGKNLLHVAAERERDKCDVTRLVYRDADLRKLVNQQDYNGNTPLHLAAAAGSYSCIKYLVSKHKRVCDRLHEVSCVKQCQRVHVQYNVTNNAGLTPLDLLRDSSEFESLQWVGAVECLVSAGAVFSPRREDPQERKDMVGDDEKTKKMSENLMLVSVLLVTITFAAGFTPPGGFDSNTGMAILAQSPLFLGFMIADGFAMTASISATSLFIFAQRNERRRKAINLLATYLVEGALTASFFTLFLGTRAMLPKDSISRLAPALGYSLAYACFLLSYKYVSPHLFYLDNLRLFLKYFLRNMGKTPQTLAGLDDAYLRHIGLSRGAVLCVHSINVFTYVFLTAVTIVTETVDYPKPKPMAPSPSPRA